MKKRLCCVVILLLCAVLTLCACSVPDGNPELTEQTRALMDAIIAGDSAAARELISKDVSNAEFNTFFSQARSFFSGVEEYELKMLNWHTNVSNGVTVRQAQFLMTAGEKTYILQTTTSSETAGIAGFHFDVYTETTSTGTWLTMQGANGAQWVFMLIGLAELGLMIWAVVDCARSKIRRKALWIVLILLGAITWTVSAVQGRFNMNVGIGFLLTNTALIRYSTGGFALRVFLPVGMIVYWAMRKKLLAEVAAREAAAMAQQYPVIYPEYPQPMEYTQPQWQSTPVYPEAPVQAEEYQNQEQKTTEEEDHA